MVLVVVILLYQGSGAILMSMHQFIVFFCLKIQAFTPILLLGKLSNEGEEVVDVCQAIQDIRMEERRIGEQEGEKRGEKRGEKNGELKKAQEDARNFYNLGIGIEKVAQGVGYNVEIVKGWVGLK